MKNVSVIILCLCLLLPRKRARLLCHKRMCRSSPPEQQRPEGKERMLPENAQIPHLPLKSIFLALFSSSNSATSVTLNRWNFVLTVNLPALLTNQHAHINTQTRTNTITGGRRSGRLEGRVRVGQEGDGPRTERPEEPCQRWRLGRAHGAGQGLRPVYSKRVSRCWGTGEILTWTCIWSSRISERELHRSKGTPSHNP